MLTHIFYNYQNKNNPIKFYGNASVKPGIVYTRAQESDRPVVELQRMLAETQKLKK